MTSIKKKVKIKIYWLNAHFLFNMGGAKFIFEIANRLSKKNKYEIIFIVNKYDQKVLKQLNKLNLKVISISNYSTNNLVYWFFLPFHIIKDFINTKNIVKDGDLLISTFFPSNLIAVFIAKFYRKNIINYCFEPFPFLQNKDFIWKQKFPKNILMYILSLLYKNLDNYAVKKSNYVLTLNNVTKKMIKNVYKRKDSIVTLMGVDSKHFHHNIIKNIEKKYSNKIIIFHSTDYSSMKKTDLAIETISHLVKKYPQLKLIITSTQPNHPNKNKLMKLAHDLGCEDNIDFLGLVSYDDLVNYYSLALVYLSCSYDEMLGTTSSNLPVKEALACETPAIRANITTEDVEDGVSGFLVDPRKTKQVAKKIEYLIKNPDLARKMGKVGREKIKKLYNWENVANVIKKVIEESISV